MCTYTFFSVRRYIAFAEFVKIRTGSAKMARKEQVCSHKKSYRKFAKMSLCCCAREGCRPSCTLIILRFLCAASDGATAERRIQNRKFSSIL